MKFEHSFDYKSDAVTYFALTFPFSYIDCQKSLKSYEDTFSDHPYIYFRRELLTKSIEGRRVDLLTITGVNDMLSINEEGIPGLFPEEKERPQRFNKPTIFVTARVHPGETQGTHMVNGLLNFLLNEYYLLFY